MRAMEVLWDWGGSGDGGGATRFVAHFVVLLCAVPAVQEGGRVFGVVVATLVVCIEESVSIKYWQ